MKNQNKMLISVAIAMLIFGITFFAGYKIANSYKPFSDILAADTAPTDDIDINAILDNCPPELCGDVVDDGVDPTTQDPATQDQPPVVKEKCTKESWDCMPWKECSANGKTTREINPKNLDESLDEKGCTKKVDCEGGYTPAEEASCTPPAPKCTEDTWSCGNFGACISGTKTGTKTRTCTRTFDCETATTPSPHTSEDCAAPVKAIIPQVTEPKDVIKEEPITTNQTAPEQKNAATEENITNQIPTETVVPTNNENVSTEQTPPQTTASAEAQNLLDNLDKTLTAEEKVAQAVKIEAAATAIETKVETQIQENLNQTKKTEEALTNEVAASPSFKAIFKDTPITVPQPIVTDANGNGIPDRLEGSNANKPDIELVQLEATLQIQEQELVTKGGKSKEEAKAIVQKVLKTKMTEKRNTAIDGIALAQYKIKAPNQTERAAIILGVSPKEMEAKKGESFSPIEKKLYHIDDNAQNTNQCSMSIQNGSKLSSDGFTVLASCPPNQAVNLVAMDKNGKEIILDSKISSENNKTIFTAKSRTGTNAFQIKPAAKVSYFDSNNWHASVLNETTSLQASNPVLVDVVSEKTVESPTVQNIENIEIAGISDLKVKATADGKIRVTGLSDITTMVIGTFQSAVFTSAILADVSTGSFTVTSAKPLESGDHEVVVYATRLEAGEAQSAPVKIKFNIIPTANAASGRIAGIKSPVLSGIVVIGALILIGIGVTLIRRKKNNNVA